MKFTKNYEPLFRRNIAAYDKAVADVLDDARHRAPRRTGKFAASLTSIRVPGSPTLMVALVGSPLASANVKEKGGYMQARAHDRLYIRQADGSVRTPQAVRVRAQPTVVPAGVKFPEYMARRVREANG